jgi:hypothetical protein
MDFDSSLYDSIRIKSKGRKKKEKSQTDRLCAWEGCNKPGTNKAPMGRGQEGKYLYFCLDHVREYNKNYNYFNGMSDEDVKDFQKASITGHRPTWTMGSNNNTTKAKGTAAENGNPFHSFRRRHAANQPDREERHVGILARRAFKRLGLETSASPEQIKEKYKFLVKRLHPDANGGDRGSEDRLREVIQAYNQLKSSGFCS